MKGNKDSYSKQVIEIADYIFANPSKKRKDVLGQFRTVWDNVSESTIKRWYYEAQEYNKPRLQRQEKEKDEVLVREAKESVKSAILSREQVLLELTNDFNRLNEIKSGSVYKSIENKTGQVIGYAQAGFMEEINAKKARQAIVQQLAKMEGWEAPAKTAQTDSKGNDITHLSPQDAAELIKEMTKDYSKKGQEGQ